MNNLAYTLNYIKRALSSDEPLEQPDRYQANGTIDVLTGLYFAHNAGNAQGAAKAWAIVEKQQPELATLVKQLEALIHADELKNLSQPAYLMDKYPIYSEAFNVLVGPSGGGKSFVALDIAGRIALDSPVIYVAGEGLSGYAQRWEAWKDFHQVSAAASLYFYKEALQLMDISQLQGFIALLQSHSPSLVIIDTLARSAVGVDENSAREMGQFVSACDALRNQLNCGLIVVHHTGKSGDIRGSTALYGASDAVLGISKIDGLVRVSNRAEHGGKNKYGEDNFEAWYKITAHEVDGFNGAVLCPAEKIKDSALEINDKEQSILLALSYFENGALVKEISLKTKTKQASLYRQLKNLQTKRFIRKEYEKFFIDEKGLEALETLGFDDESEADDNGYESD